MHIKKIFKVLSILLISIISIGMAGCADLGDFDDIEDYYSAISNVHLIDSNLSHTSYSMSKFYSDSTVNDFECCNSESNYKYIACELEKEITIDSLSLWFNSSKTCSIDMGVYVLNTFPFDFGSEKEHDIFYGKYVFEDKYLIFDGLATNGAQGTVIYFDTEFSQTEQSYSYTVNTANRIAKFTIGSNPATKKSFEIELTSDGLLNVVYTKYGLEHEVGYFTYDEEGTTEYEERFLTNKIASVSLNLIKNEWNSFTIDEWKVDSEELDNIKISAGRFIVFKIENNTIGSKRKNLSSVSFKTTNLMVRAIKVEG